MFNFPVLLLVTFKTLLSVVSIIFEYLNIWVTAFSALTLLAERQEGHIRPVKIVITVALLWDYRKMFYKSAPGLLLYWSIVSWSRRLLIQLHAVCVQCGVKVSSGSLRKSLVSRVFVRQVQRAAALQRRRNQVLLGYQVHFRLSVGR